VIGNVVGPVIVAVHGNGNGTVDVTGTVDGSWIDQLGQHRYDPLEQLGAAYVVLRSDQLLDSHDVEVCRRSIADPLEIV